MQPPFSSEKPKKSTSPTATAASAAYATSSLASDLAAGNKKAYEPQGEAIFHPLDTSTNISKDEVELLETTLKADRENARV